MSDAKHTPGPWKIVYRVGRDNLPSLLDVNGDHVPLSQKSNPVALANAVLIAAAPDMAEALREAVASMRANMFIFKNDKLVDFKFPNLDWMEKANAALAKAGQESEGAAATLADLHQTDRLGRK